MAKEEKKNKKAKKGKEEKAKKPKAKQNTGSSDAQVVRSLDGSIALTKLQHVMMTKKGKKDKKIRGIFIPLDLNFLEESDNGAVYLNVRVNLKDKEDEYNQHGFIGQSVASSIYKAASDEEKEKMQKTPILGGLKDWTFEAGSSDNSGSVGQEQDEEDDLPF